VVELISVRVRKLCQEIGLVTLARVIVIACQLINIKLYTNYLSVEQLGLYFFLLALSFFANALIFGPIDYYQQANLAKLIQTTGGLRPFLVFNWKLAAIYLSFTLLMTIGGVLIAPHFVYHIILSAALAITLYIVQTLRNTLNNLEHKGVMSFSLAQEAIVKIMIFLLLMRYGIPNELMLMLAWLIALIITAVSLFLRAHEYGIFLCNEKYTVEAKDVFHFSYPISIAAVCNWIQLQGYRLVLVPLGFAEIVGIFATIASIGSAVMAAAATIFSQIFSPSIYKTSGQYTIKYLRNALVLITIILLVCILFGDFVVKISTRAVFEPYWSLMIFGVLNDASNLIIGALAIHITLTNSTKKIMSSSVLGVVAFVASFGLLFFMHNVTVYTIGIPLIFSQMVVAVYMYWNFRNA
jgi:O-antigen/teichoic acid export membrane protein